MSLFNTLSFFSHQDEEGTRIPVRAPPPPQPLAPIFVTLPNPETDIQMSDPQVTTMIFFFKITHV